MRVFVTGAMGFVGRHVVDALLDRGCEVVVAGRDRAGFEAMPWAARVRFEELDLEAGGHDGAFERLGRPERAVHLAWSGLPNYMDLAHVERNVWPHYAFWKAMFDGGLGHLLCVGTCLEYGMREGCLREDMAPAPANPYAAAKDSLRRFLGFAAEGAGAVFQWARLFYLHGPGQGANSLLAQLDRALDEGRDSFDMSGGEQLRDYLRVERAASMLAALALQDEVAGVVNCCSGEPVSVRTLVERHMLRRGRSIALNLGVYPYPSWEPMAFWGDAARIRSVEGVR